MEGPINNDFKRVCMAKIDQARLILLDVYCKFALESECDSWAAYRVESLLNAWDRKLSRIHKNLEKEVQREARNKRKSFEKNGF